MHQFSQPCFQTTLWCPPPVMMIEALHSLVQVAVVSTHSLT